MASRILVTSCSLRPGRPVRGRSLTSSNPSLNFLCKPNTILLKILVSPFSMSLMSLHGVIFEFTQNLMTHRCLIFNGVAMPSCLICIYGIPAQQRQNAQQWRQEPLLLTFRAFLTLFEQNISKIWETSALWLKVPRKIGGTLPWRQLCSRSDIVRQLFKVHVVVTYEENTLKRRPVLHHCVVIFFWSSGIM